MEKLIVSVPLNVDRDDFNNEWRNAEFTTREDLDNAWEAYARRCLCNRNYEGDMYRDEFEVRSLDSLCCLLSEFDVDFTDRWFTHVTILEP